MQENSWSIALAEFVHVGGALFVIIAIVSVLTGIMREYIPQDKIQQKLAKHENRGPLIGALLGTLTPFCSASMVPVVMGMVEMGVSMATVFAFLVSAPLCNFVVVGLILAVFGLKAALMYFLLTLCGAILAGYVIGRTPLRYAVKRHIAPPAAPTCGATPRASGSVPAKAGCNAVVGHEVEALLCEEERELGLIAAAEAVGTGCNALPHTAKIAPACAAAAVVDRPECGMASALAGETTHAKRVHHALLFAWALFKRIMPYVLLGSIISAISAAFLPAEMVENYVGGDNWYAIPVAAGIGVPLYLRIEMAIPLLKVLIAKGMGTGAAMALLIGGTGASLPEIAIISSVLKPKAVVAFVATVFTVAVIGGVIFSVVPW